MFNTSSSFGGFGSSFLQNTQQAPQQLSQQLPQQQAPPNPNADHIVHTAGQDDTVTALRFGTAGAEKYLLASSWGDKSVTLFEIALQGTQLTSTARMRTQSTQPVLSCDFAGEAAKVVFGGCDAQVKLWNVQSNQVQTMGTHGAPVKDVLFVTELGMVVSGSWDSTIKYWDMRTSQAVATIQVPERVYAMATFGQVLVVATADKKYTVYNVKNPQTPYRIIDLSSTQKFQCRSVSVFPDQKGFAVGVVDGRCFIQLIHEQDIKEDSMRIQSEKKIFPFKCHRDNDLIYSVNSVAFNQNYGTFATAGGDGTYIFWDKDAKARLKSAEKMHSPITVSTFNPSGNVYAYALGYDWSKGIAHPDRQQSITQICLHYTPESEIQKRMKK